MTAGAGLVGGPRRHLQVTRFLRQVGLARCVTYDINGPVWHLLRLAPSLHLARQTPVCIHCTQVHAWSHTADGCSVCSSRLKHVTIHVPLHSNSTWTLAFVHLMLG